MKFHLVAKGSPLPQHRDKIAFLKADNWNDYSFVTMFHLSIVEDGIEHVIGALKIGYNGQETTTTTSETLDKKFDRLEKGYFSLGVDVDYYQNLTKISLTLREELLKKLNDVAFDEKLLNASKNEKVFQHSLLRGVSISTIEGQYMRILSGTPLLTDFRFKYCRNAEEKMAGIELAFKVKANSKPSTNIHALIGRNGIGKTTLLNGMIEAFVSESKKKGAFLDFEKNPLRRDFFGRLVSVSFSAFDPYMPPEKKVESSKENRYSYVGLRNTKSNDQHSLKTLPDLFEEFEDSLTFCLSESNRSLRWLNAIKVLQSDENFSEMKLLEVPNLNEKELRGKISRLFNQISSGHMIILLTITKLVASIEEKTLVLIDEPESHLHPPLLSAFIRSLVALLHDRNGVCIIATHSPVVLQEIPKTCVWKISRSGLAMTCKRPENETFGENVGTLTREVFGLEVEKSGFHQLLIKSVEKGGSYDELLEEYGDQLGFEARAILRSLVINRDRELQS